MPAGDRKIAAYLRELALQRALKRALILAEQNVQSRMRALNGGEIARATRLIEQGLAPEVTIKARWVKLGAGRAV